MQLDDTLSHNTCSVREENFRLHVEKVVVKCHHRHIQSCACGYVVLFGSCALSVCVCVSVCDVRSTWSTW